MKRLTAAFSSVALFVHIGFADSTNCVPPPSGLVSWWKAEGNPLDQAGTNNGTLVGNATYAPGRVGQQFVFDGDRDAVAVGTAADLQLQDFTIETWCSRASTTMVTAQGPAYDALLFSYGSGGYGFGLSYQGKPLLSKIDVNSLTPSIAITDTNFHHLAVTKSGTNVVFYVDGVAYTVPAYVGVFTFSTPAAIGAASDLRRTFLGTIDELSVYNRALSETEIQAIYNAGGMGKCWSPRITGQPVSQLGFWGKSIAFHVTADGSQPLSYQWSKDGTPVTGATNNSLVLTNLQMTDAGAYSVVVANFYGSVTSNPAILTINPAGVSIALYAGVTIDGVVGLTYGIQSTTDLSNTNSWRGLANVTLGVPMQLWFDVQPATQPQRYYRVVPGPISIP